MAMVALVRRLNPVEDLHQRGLAGTVLADDGVNGALAHLQADVAVGDHSREALGDAGQLNGQRLEVGRLFKERGTHRWELLIGFVT